MSNWIDDVLQDCEHVETPRSWLYWGLLCSLSAAASNNYFLVALNGAVVYRPNLYVILMGQSGLGKDFPIRLATNLVEMADVTRVISGRSSIQAIVRELSITRTRPDKQPLEDSRGFIVNGEMSTALISDPDALTILTDLYDNKKTWTNMLKGDGKEKLRQPCITALFGSSPAHFYDKVPQVNIEGGYIGRNLIIREERRYKDSDLFGDDDRALEFPYEKYFGHLSKIAGETHRILPSLEAKEYFNMWRRQWRKDQQQDVTGFLNRVPDHSLKVAMLLNLAEHEPDHIISLDQIQEAIAQVSALTYTTRQAVEGTGMDPTAAQTKMVLDFLLQAPENKLFRKQLLSKGYGNYDSIMLDKIIDHLVDVEWVEKNSYRDGVTVDWQLKLKGKPKQDYEKFIADQLKKQERRAK